MNISTTHDKVTIEDPGVSLLDQVQYRYKDGDLAFFSPSFLRKWTRENLWAVEEKMEGSVITYDQSVRLVLVVLVDMDPESFSQGMPDVDYIFCKHRVILLSNSLTAKSRLWVKPAKVERREEEDN